MRVVTYSLIVVLQAMMVLGGVTMVGNVFDADPDTSPATSVPGYPDDPAVAPDRLAGQISELSSALDAANR